jgi:VanZ family protein
VHAAVFAAVAFTGRRAGVPWTVLGVVLVLHAGLSEVIQAMLLPHRQGDPQDVVADVAGTLLGLLAGGRRRPHSTG